MTSGSSRLAFSVGMLGLERLVDCHAEHTRLDADASSFADTVECLVAVDKHACVVLLHLGRLEAPTERLGVALQVSVVLRELLWRGSHAR